MTGGGAIVLVDLDALAAKAGLHPDLVRRLVGLAGVDPADPGAPARLARMARLHHDLGLNWAGAILVCELLARIDELEERRSWIRTN